MFNELEKFYDSLNGLVNFSSFAGRNRMDITRVVAFAYEVMNMRQEWFPDENNEPPFLIRASKELVLAERARGKCEVYLSRSKKEWVIDYFERTKNFYDSEIAQLEQHLLL